MANCNLIGAFSSDTTISTPVAINKGGTGQTTAQAALDALAAASGTLVRGDILIVDSSLNLVRLARGSDNQTLMINGSDPNWETVAAGGGKAFFTVFNDNQTGTSSTFYGCNSSEVEVTTEVGMSSEINTALTCTRSVVHLTANAKAATQTYAFRDDSADIAAVDVTSTSTGFFDSGAVSEAIASGSLINFNAQFSQSGSVDIRGWIVELDT